MTPDDTDAVGRTEAVRDAVDDEKDTDRVPDIPRETVVEAERLTRLARTSEHQDTDSPHSDAKRPAVPAESDVYRERRDELVAAHDYETRIREEDDTLVLYPAEWLEDGVVQFDRVEETDRGVEVPLSGAGDPERWQDVAEHNEELAADVEAAYGAAHGANARAFATFISNHYAKEIERATPAEVTEFIEEYYPRNTWPSAARASLVEESVEKTFEVADAESSVIDSEP